MKTNRVMTYHDVFEKTESEIIETTIHTRQLL